MKSMQNLLSNLYLNLVDIEGLDVYHFERPDDFKLPYAVWSEQGEADSFHSDNDKQDQVLNGSLDFFTQTEFDSLADDIQEKLNSIEGCGWTLASVQYEDSTKLIHYTWDWELI